MIKLIAFDLDGTLAEQGKGLKPETIKSLKSLEDKGVKIALCSGKTAFYLCGLLRQLEFKNPIIVGENGADIQFGTDLPPTVFHFAEYSKRVANDLIWIEQKIRYMFDNKLWFQPNRIGVTPFPTSQEGFDKIKRFIAKHKRRFAGLEVYEHADCFDIVPKGISKKVALQEVARMLNIKTSQIIAVGDGVNDYPMFEVAGLSIGINLKDKNITHVNFDTIQEAIQYINQKEVLSKSYHNKQKNRLI